MIARIAGRRHSFKVVAAYLMHDKGAKTSERVTWTATGNMRTDDVEKSAVVMARTVEHRDEIRAAYDGSTAGAKPTAGNAYHPILSWAIDENPSEQEQRDAVQSYLEHMGLDGHEYFAVGHNDTAQVHVHVVVNLVDYRTGKVHDLSWDKRDSQKWALEYERVHGLKCEQRERNAAKREKGIRTKHQDSKQDYAAQVTEAYAKTRDGKAFAAALAAQGLTLAGGRRRGGFVLVDQQGDIQKLARQLEVKDKAGKVVKGAAKTAAIRAKLGDLDRASLPDADMLAWQRKQAGQEASVTKFSTPAHTAEPQRQQRKQASVAKSHTPANDAKPQRQLVLEWGKEQKAHQQHRHRLERKELETQLRAERKEKDEAIKTKWHFAIEQNRQKENALKAKLEQEGIRGKLWRAGFGAQAQKDMEGYRKSRLNAEVGQAEELAQLDKADRRRKVHLRQSQGERREALDGEINKAQETGELPKRQTEKRYKKREGREKVELTPEFFGLSIERE